MEMEGHAGHHGHASGQGAHAGHHAGEFLKKFWVVLALTAPIFTYSDMFSALSGVTPPRFPGESGAMLILGSVVFFYGGSVFLRGAARELKARLPGMMTLISLAIISAYTFSVYQFARGQTETLFWELASLIAIMLLGHYFEMKSVESAKSALNSLAKLLPETATLLKGGVQVPVSLSELTAGDVVIVKPGEKIPADGVVVEGASDVNESLVTGESAPVSKKTRDAVIAGAVNGDGSLTISVTGVGEKTFLAGVMRLVAEAESSKSRLQILSDRAAFFLTIVAVLAGALTFGAWMFAGAGFAFSIERLVSVLVVACPHALGLAVPLVAAISTSMAAKNGLLIRKRLSLESAREVDTVVFDKTGTLTEGKFAVTAVSSDEALALAASVEAHSEHPMARAIVEEAKKQNLFIIAAKDFYRIPGAGAQASVGGKRVFVGQRGGADVVVEADGEKIGTIALADTPRKEAKEAVAALKRLGVRVVMLTGDSKEAAEKVAADLGIEEYFARVMPAEKAEKIKLLQQKGAKVAMVGGGVNDAPALARADVGIAIGAGTNVAVESAGIILVKDDPRDIPKIIRLSRLTRAKMLQNLFWAAGYNVVAIPLASGVLFSEGIVLTPAVAAILMSASTVIVAFNVLLLRRRTL